MPELPEVEVVRHGLQAAITGSRIESLTVFEPRSLRRHLGGSQDFVDRLQGKILLAAVRRGKFLWFPLADSDNMEGNGEALLAHLGMSGQLLLRDRGADADKLTRIQLLIEHPESGPFAINFVDQRIFGSLAIDLLEPLDAPGGFCGASQGFSTMKLANSIP
ncbi:MAG: DNA-formamidopyrimidine glycosylase family protein, partial [Microbacteriaceae bacterium]